jgi:hypothetical protein
MYDEKNVDDCVAFQSHTCCVGVPAAMEAPADVARNCHNHVSIDVASTDKNSTLYTGKTPYKSQYAITAENPQDGDLEEGRPVP